MNYIKSELEKLYRNPKQKEAFLADDHCVVLAGPGSGKTATLSLKIARLLDEKIVPPSGLACLTFNNEAVREFKNRLKKLCIPQHQNIFLGTVHSFCLSCVLKPYSRLFRPKTPYPIVIANDDVVNASLQQALDRVGVREEPSRYKTRLDRYRRTNLDRDTPEWNYNEEVANVITEYESILHEKGFLDFDDIILLACDLIEKEHFVQRCLKARFPWFIIDEYQDLGFPLHRIVLSLINQASVKLFAVGDPDQSIYGFTGADPKYLEELQSREDIQTIVLEFNYRCGQNIIDGAEIILSPTTERGYTSYRGDDDRGEIHFVYKSDGITKQVDTIINEILPQSIASGYQPKDIAVLYIDRFDGDIIREEFDKNDIKYSGEKDRRYNRTRVTRWLEEIAQWICDIDGTNKILFNEISKFWYSLLNEANIIVSEKDLLQHYIQFFQILKSLSFSDMMLMDWLKELDVKLSLSGILNSIKDSPYELEAFHDLRSKCEEGNSLYEFKVVDFAGCGANSNVISLNTLHSSKGLQFDVVIMPGLEEGRMHWTNANVGAIREARRKFYVGFTRARYHVYLLYSGWYENKFGRWKSGPSNFLLELQRKLEAET